jgi:signal transduction histidine kinase
MATSIRTPRPRQALEREVRRLTARLHDLEARNRDLDAYAHMAAHELMEPLVLTEAHSSMARDRLDPELDADVVGDLQTVIDSARRSRRMVEALLLDARAAPARRDAVDLNETTRQSLEALGREIAGRRATVVVGPLPWVTGDPALLGVVMTNLIANAVKYGRRAGPVVHVTASATPGTWTVHVTSDGPRICERDRARIFAPSVRGAMARDAPGAGLGLAICRRIIERHGGRISVAPLDPAGNDFHFTLPG